MSTAKTRSEAPGEFWTRYFWKGVDWAAKPLGEDKHDDLTKAMLTPDTAVQEALDTFHGHFYPSERKETVEQFEVWAKRVRQRLREMPTDASAVAAAEQEIILSDPLHTATTPCVGHQAAHNCYTLMDRVDLYAKSLKGKLADDWYLSWHWRAVLPYIRNWDPYDQKTMIIQVCQIRAWQLLLCYRVSRNVSLNELPGLPLREKDLIRAPLFGVSHRLKRWDVYRLFYEAETAKAIRNAMDAARGNLSAQAYVLGRHDCYYQIHEVNDDNNKGIRIKASARLDIHPHQYALDDTIKGKITKGLDDLPLAHSPNLVDIPAFAQQDGSSVLLASNNYCRALDQLAEVMNDPTAKSVLIIAPPGSGKEDLARSAHLCRNRSAIRPNTVSDTRWGRLATTSLARSRDLDGVQRALFSCGRVQHFVDKAGYLRPDFEPEPTDGLVFQAVGGALFIDEIDKTDADGDVRSLLLRFLESAEMTIPGSSLIVRLRKEQIPLYIFAASSRREDLFAMEPPDFWTRISHVVEMLHPLRLDDAAEMNRVLCEYVRTFWQKHVREFLDQSGHTGDAALAGCKSASLYRKYLTPYFNGLLLFLLSDSTVAFISSVVANKLTKPDTSIRRIRSVVGRCVFRAIEFLLHAKENDSPVEALKEYYESTLSASKEATEWFKLLTTIIKSGATASPEKKFLKSFKSEMESAAETPE